MDFRVLREIGMIARCLNTIADAEYKRFNLEKGQFLYVVRVCEYPGINQETLSNMLKVDRSTTAKAVGKLSKQGYIRKERSEKDKRAYKLYPTPRARQAYDVLRQVEENASERALRDFSDEERMQVLSLLAKMRKNAEGDWARMKAGEHVFIADQASDENAD
jgi:DNA-binding MarR family transcriptional regulator